MKKIHMCHSDDMLHFYLRTAAGDAFLFSKRPYYGLRNYFRRDISLGELRRHKCGKDCMVDDVVDMLTYYMD